MGFFSKILGKEEKNFVSPMTGKVLKMEDVPDPAFAQKMMGDGCAIELTEGTVIAPFDAEVVAAFPTGHAYGLRALQDNTEILIHIGIDTVELEGEGFETKVSMGDTVKQGDVLVKVDIKYIAESGKSLVSPIAFSGNKAVEVHKVGEMVHAGDRGLLNYK